jgi:hypothetical protein
VNEQEDIPIEDQEDPNFEECFEPGEDDVDSDMLLEPSAGLTAKGKDSKYVVNLFPYVAPVAAHTRILSDLLRCNQRTHLLLLTRTAHPGLIVAAREANLKVIVLMSGVNQHSRMHGQQLMKQIFMIRKYSVAKAAVPKAAGGQKRLRQSDLQFIVVEAPSEQTVRIRDVEIKTESSWRGGLNKCPMLLEDKVMRQLQHELDNHQLALNKINGVMHLVATKAFRENDKICDAAGLVFDSLDKLRAYLDAGDINKVLVSVLIRIDGVHMNEEDPPEVGSLYLAPTGAVRYARHYHPNKRSPNAALSVDVAAGANDGLVSMVVRTRNKVGIAPGTPILINFGIDYDHEAATKVAGDPDTKRLKGMLENYFSRLGAENAAMEVDVPGTADRKDLPGTADRKAKVNAPAPKVPTPAPPPAPPPPPTPEPPLASAPAAGGPALTGDAGVSAPAGSSSSTTEPTVTPKKADPTKSIEPSKDAAKPIDDPNKKPPEPDTPRQIVKLTQGEVSVGEVSTPNVSLVVAFAPPREGFAGSLVLVAKDQIASNKKIPPQTVLRYVREGQVIKSTLGGPPYGWTKTKLAWVCEKPGENLSPLTTLESYLKDKNAKSVAKHEPFTGTPKELKPPAGMQFVADTDDMKAFLKFVMQLSDVSVGWVVKTKDG